MENDSPAALAAVWHLYIIETDDGRLYTGITVDVERRFKQHQCGKGAKALRGAGELRLVYRCLIGEHSLALRLEYRIKQLNRRQKERLVQDQPSLSELSRLLGCVA
ncbi:UPF0213 protein [Leminorella grimontii]|uniref:UPF0213 protein n=1 Tax=Leminorella grimontii TaxID=82981 RepID=A0AAV5N6Q9_9GAMM|nr:GIY-YIG nuclease family protein [Leminorella grimontii]KFC94800.1 putative URI domain-containing endonuclease [Leminorella grimontii ATCC 33999 = DSM 5078]GKX56543.1 UPF0213 protein [Leminorella grimontii]VFS61601.1 GIY-YIG nuclease superfamily protein [Leminorella grimontii]